MPKGNIKQLFRRMLADGRNALGRPIVRSAGVFTLEVTQFDTGTLKFSVDKLDIAPTNSDWVRFLAQWPEAVPDGVVPSTRKVGRRYALVGQWARPAEMAETSA
jgi:hypothetical protein